MGRYARHVFGCTVGDRCPLQADVEQYGLIYDPGVKGAHKVEEKAKS